MCLITSESDLIRLTTLSELAHCGHTQSNISNKNTEVEDHHKDKTIVFSSLKVCMVKKYILYFVVTPRNFIIAKLSIRKPADEDPGLRIENFAIIKLRGVTTKYKI